MNISWGSSHWRKDAGAANSTHREEWSGFLWRCCNLTMGEFTIPAAARPAMFVQSMEFIRSHRTRIAKAGRGNGGRTRADISIYGQESNHTT